MLGTFIVLTIDKFYPNNEFISSKSFYNVMMLLKKVDSNFRSKMHPLLKFPGDHMIFKAYKLASYKLVIKRNPTKLNSNKRIGQMLLYLELLLII